MKTKLLICIWLFSGISIAADALENTIRINEISASNKQTLFDEDGDAADWIELYNYGETSINLSGWHLTTNPTRLDKWTFPDVDIQSGAFLVVFASDKNRTNPVKALHTNFKLDSRGEYLALTDADGNLVSELNPYPLQLQDESYGLSENKQGFLRWCYFDIPTPGMSNTASVSARLPRPSFSTAHGSYEDSFYLTLTAPDDSCCIYYTTNGDVPCDSNAIRYETPLFITGTSIIRAVSYDLSIEKIQDSRPATSSYFFMEDIIQQPLKPDGYPSEWGPYSSIEGTAIGDYEMDPELMSDPDLAAKTIAGLKTLPIISIVTDRRNLFRKTKDDNIGGIYIYTGGSASSTGGGYGYGWLRPASVEFISQTENKETQIDCALKIHGNASRQAEKTPKHSFRIQFKSEYGPTKLEYPLFGEDEVQEFNQLVLRAGFGNTWCHWTTDEQKRAMFTRDPWSKRMLKAMGWPTPNTTYAHLFLNGLYWGIYNPIERIDEDFSATLMGGDGDDYDVIRISDGEGLEAQKGNMEAYSELFTLAQNAANRETYLKMQGKDSEGNDNASYPVLLNVDNFIDYILLNQYGGNTDWDHHNWVAVRSRSTRDGFYFMCWDAEHVLKNLNDNRLSLNNKNCPTNLFNLLMQNKQFKMTFADRMALHCLEEDGCLTPDHAQQVWSILNDEIDQAVYAESARWGDYRRDVHPWASRGSLYTKENQFDAQKRFMTETYFPQRTEYYINQLKGAGFIGENFSLTQLLINNELSKSIEKIDQDDVLTLTGNGIVYYTLNGRDPLEWSSGNGLLDGQSANKYTGTLSIRQNCHIYARSLRNGKWGPLMKREIIYDGFKDELLSPQNDLFTIESTLSGEELQVIVKSGQSGRICIKIYDTQGRLLLAPCENAINPGNNHISLHTASLPTGIYLMKINMKSSFGNSSKVLKFNK